MALKRSEPAGEGGHAVEAEKARKSRDLDGLGFGVGDEDSTPVCLREHRHRTPTEQIHGDDVHCARQAVLHERLWSSNVDDQELRISIDDPEGQFVRRHPVDRVGPLVRWVRSLREQPGPRVGDCCRDERKCDPADGRHRMAPGRAAGAWPG